MSAPKDVRYNVELPTVKGFITYLMRADGKPVVHFKLGTHPDQFIFAAGARQFGEQLIAAAGHAETLAEAFKAIQKVAAEYEAETGDIEGDK